jgi:F-type H+-transporting ATPase subunit delta
VTGALSIHYARALANSAFQPDSGITPEEAVQQLRTAESVISGSRDLQIALLSPAVNKARKSAVISKISDVLGLHRTIRNFLSVVTKHGRTTQLKSMRQSFEDVVDERLGWVRAEISSALELDAGQRQEIERALGVKLDKFIRADYKVDPALLAGVRALVGSKEYDATLRGKLEAMRESLHVGFSRL